MKFAQSDVTDGNLIESYDRTRIRISGRDYGVSLTVTADEVAPNWGPERIDDLTAEHIETLLAADPQVVVIGTGTHQHIPDPELYFALLERGVGVEFMDTGAACRTYNILVGEGRRVIAALLLD
ncbi:MAG: Mth938-like domain-containing protein [Thiohalocapsa sp.]|jgi:uncharacterized protein